MGSMIVARRADVGGLRPLSLRISRGPARGAGVLTTRASATEASLPCRLWTAPARSGAGSTFACNFSIDPRAAARSRLRSPLFCRSSSSACLISSREASAACRLLTASDCKRSTFVCNSWIDPRAAARLRSRSPLFCRSSSSACIVCASEASAACRLLTAAACSAAAGSTFACKGVDGPRVPQRDRVRGARSFAAPPRALAWSPPARPRPPAGS